MVGRNPSRMAGYWVGFKAVGRIWKGSESCADRRLSGMGHPGSPSTAAHTEVPLVPQLFNPMPQGISERTSMNLNRSFGLVLALACVAQATDGQTGLGPKESPAQLRARLQQAAPGAAEPREPRSGQERARGAGRTRGPPGQPGCITGQGGAPGQLAGPAGLEAYQLFKELGREMPRRAGTAIQCQPDGEPLERERCARRAAPR
jgi:hypothetical protein